MGGPQRVTDIAEESKRFDGWRDILLDGPQRGEINKMSRRGRQQTNKAILGCTTRAHNLLKSLQMGERN